MGETATSAAEVAQWAPEVVRFEKHPDKWVRRAVVSALADVGGLASEQIDVPVAGPGERSGGGCAGLGGRGHRGDRRPQSGDSRGGQEAGGRARGRSALKAASERGSGSRGPGEGRAGAGSAADGFGERRLCRSGRRRRRAPLRPSNVPGPQPAASRRRARARLSRLPALEEDGVRYELLLPRAQRARPRDGAGVSRRRHGSERPRRRGRRFAAELSPARRSVLAPAAADRGAGEGDHESAARGRRRRQPRGQPRKHHSHGGGDGRLRSRDPGNPDQGRRENRREELGRPYRLRNGALLRPRRARGS